MSHSMDIRVYDCLDGNFMIRVDYDAWLLKLKPELIKQYFVNQLSPYVYEHDIELIDFVLPYTDECIFEVKPYRDFYQYAYMVVREVPCTRTIKVCLSFVEFGGDFRLSVDIPKFEVNNDIEETKSNATKILVNKLNRPVLVKDMKYKEYNEYKEYKDLTIVVYFTLTGRMTKNARSLD